jgi:hypothetical protein
MQSRDEFVDDLKRKLDDWNSQIAKAEAQMRAGSEKAQVQIAEEVAEMKRQRDAAEGTMRDALRKSADEWKKRQRDFEHAWNDISDGFARAWARIV